MAKVINPETGDLYTDLDVEEIEEAGIRSHNIQDECVDCALDDSAMVFEDPAHADLIRAYVRGLDSLEGYEFEGSEEEPQLRIFEGEMEETLQDFTNAIRDALERRAAEEAVIMRWTVETNGGTMTVNRSQSATDALLDMATDVHRYMLEGGLEDPEGYDHYQFQRGYLRASHGG